MGNHSYKTNSHTHTYISINSFYLVKKNLLKMNFGVKIETSNEFFVGNLNKTKTRDEIFQDLTNIEIDCLKEKLYITKFNMPKFNARKDQNGNLLLNLGYAFVTTKKPEMAQELIRKKRLLLEDGTDIEFKPISKTKRLQANQACKNKNATKISELVEDKKVDFGPIGSRRKSSSTESLQNNFQSGVQSQFVKNSSFNNFPTYSHTNDFMIGNFGDSVFNDFSSQNSSSQNSILKQPLLLSTPPTETQTDTTGDLISIQSKLKKKLTVLQFSIYPILVNI